MPVENLINKCLPEINMNKNILYFDKNLSEILKKEYELFPIKIQILLLLQNTF